MQAYRGVQVGGSGDGSTGRETRSFHLLMFSGADSYFSPPVSVHLSKCWA